MIRLLAICGSLKVGSSNFMLLQAIAALASDRFSVSLLQGLDKIPAFNPDLDTSRPPIEVAEMRARMNLADAILISTPEYAMGVPGVLKNALDWTVSSMEFSKKPVALITGSVSGLESHQSLLKTLLVLEAKLTHETELVIRGLKSKLTPEGLISDSETLRETRALISALHEMCEGRTPPSEFLNSVSVGASH